MKSNYDFNTDFTKPPLYKMDPSKQKQIHETIKKAEKEWNYRQRKTKQFRFVLKAFAICSILLFLLSTLFTGKLQDYATGVVDYIQQNLVLDQVKQTYDFEIQNGVEFEREWMKGSNYAVVTFEGSTFQFYGGVTLDEKINGALEVVITSPEGEVKNIRYLFEQKSAIKVKAIRDNNIILTLAPDGNSRYYNLLTRRVITNN
ncbi:hypothetical protein IM538_12190 [Cytobacillus suaedae]|nr:hypothetical protein IM538_12190 [Cytobacillus suaedae]